jgi:transcription elongation factor GreA
MSIDEQMTPEGYAALKAEVEDLEGRAREEIAENIRVARGFGDLKENAEYHEAKNAQARLETRILTLRGRLAAARVVEPAAGDVVGFGSAVEVEDEQSGRVTTYTIVSATEASLPDGKLSAESPVAHALTGRRAGDVARVPTPRGERRFKVRSVS